MKKFEIKAKIGTTFLQQKGRGGRKGAAWGLRALPLAALMTAMVVASSCTRDNEEELFSDSCTPVNISYDVHIEPIIRQNCRGCHGGPNPQSGFALETYEDAKSLADFGALPGLVNYEDPDYPPMPPGGKMDRCSIQLLTTWAEAGAPR